LFKSLFIPARTGLQPKMSRSMGTATFPEKPTRCNNLAPGWAAQYSPGYEPISAKINEFDKLIFEYLMSNMEFRAAELKKSFEIRYSLE